VLCYTREGGCGVLWYFELGRRIWKWCGVKKKKKKKAELIVCLSHMSHMPDRPTSRFSPRVISEVSEGGVD
jgi:hypothetical protein